MKISNLLERVGAFQSNKSAKVQKEPSRYESQNKGNEAGEDKVSISPLAKQFSQYSSILADDENQRKLRAEAIKNKIDSGTYSVPSSDVARALVGFSPEEE